MHILDIHKRGCGFPGPPSFGMQNLGGDLVRSIFKCMNELVLFVIVMNVRRISSIPGLSTKQ